MHTSLTRRGILAGAAGLAAIGGLSACTGNNTATPAASGSSSALTPIKANIGYIADYNGSVLFALANEKKLWEKYGLTPSLKSFDNGPLQIQALGTGDLDFGYIGPGAMWLPASGRAQVCAINAVGNADRVIAQAGITSMADLKGKKVGVPEGTSGDMILRMALDKAGMTESDIERVVMDPPTIVAAFSAKQIDGAGIWYPLISNIKKQVPDLVELAQNNDFADKIAFVSAFVMQQDLGTKNKDLVMRMIKVFREANDLRASDPAGAVKAALTMLPGANEASVTEDAKNVMQKTTAELDKLTTDGTISTWLKAMDASNVASGKVKQDALVGPEKYYTGDLYVEAGK